MTSIHIINRSNRAYYDDVLNGYHRKRHDIFVEERGWNNLRKKDGLEVDEYDDDNAVYILALDGEKLVGGQRLYPSVLPHMLSEVFPHLVERILPRDENTLEWTRYFVVRERRMGRTDCRLLAAVQQYCLEEGIDRLTAVVEMWWLPRWQQAGFKVRPLGLPLMIEGQPTAAVSIEISDESLDAVLKMGGLKSQALTRHVPDPAFERRYHAD